MRGDVARAVVESGWDLNELRPAAMSLEEIFLQLTGSEAPAELEAVAAGETKSMKNIWIICRKELRSYFVSPVAYILLVMFAVIFGFFFWNSLGYFVNMAMEATMEGEQFPMNVNEQVMRPLLANINVIGLFFIPLITMRLFAEEKRSGTIELLTTSPITDSKVIIGKWLAARDHVCADAAHDGAGFHFPVQLRQSRLEAAGHRISGPAAAGRRIARHRNVYFLARPKIRSSPAP